MQHHRDTDDPLIGHMLTFDEFRKAQPALYPDQAVYAAFAAQMCGLKFAALDSEGLIFSVASATAQIWFGGGRCSYYPQNNATAATLAADKFLSAEILHHVGIPTLGGQYFFLTERHRAHRSPGHERADAFAYFDMLGGHAFAKPLIGSRGDFAQGIHDRRTLNSYLDNVAQHYDSIIMQRIVTGEEYRIFVLDESVLYSARKQPPHVTGDGATPLRDLIAARDMALVERGISGVASGEQSDAVLSSGERWTLPGRMNRSAGGQMVFADPPAGATDLAIKAVKTLGLRTGGVDLFFSVDNSPQLRVIEINANPSIRFLEDSGREDLILTIWKHTFASMGLLDV